MKNRKDYGGYARTKNTLIMLRIILEHGIIQRREICKILDVSDRQILKYVNDLRECGINVKSKTGVYGGYYIDDWECPICNSKLFTKKENELK